MLGSLGRQLRPRRAPAGLSRSVSQALSDPAAWNSAPVLVTILPNGIKVATKETFGEVATIGVCLDAGVRNETKDTAGAANIIGKLALTGTKKRPKAQLETDVESIGASLSTSVGREQSSYMITTGKTDLKQGFDIVSDIVTGVQVDSFGAQKDAIIRALEETAQPTRSVIEDRLHMTAFRDSSLGFTSIGPFEHIGLLNKDHLAAYLASSFTADKMVVAAAGPVKHEEVVALATAALGGVKAVAPHYEEKPYFCGAELIYRNDEMGPTAYVAVGWPGVPWKSPDAVTFMLMQSIVGSYSKGAGLVPGTISGNRVINAVANKMSVGCADEYEAFNFSYKDTGMFGFYARCDEVAVEHCTGELMFGMNMLAFSVTDEEVERGKRELKVKLFGGDGSTSSAAAEVGQQVIAYGRGVSPAEMILRIDAIDSEEVKRCAWTYLNDQDIAVTALGPLHGMPQYVDLRRATTMHRY